MSLSELADAFRSTLRLEIEPVGVSFVHERPEDLPEPESVSPSACGFWRKAESGVFYAPAAAHLNCPIGALTMGFELPEAAKADLMNVIGAMTSCGYLCAEEIEHIPAVKARSAGIVYGPLRELPMDPDLVILWLTPRQAMIFSEAARTSHWTAEAPASALGRPACTALPVALQGDRPVLSLGCTGMRTFTGVRDDHLLAVVPGSRIEEVVASLKPIVDANGSMQVIYNQRLAGLTGA